MRKEPKRLKGEVRGDFPLSKLSTFSPYFMATPLNLVFISLLLVYTLNERLPSMSGGPFLRGFKLAVIRSPLGLLSIVFEAVMDANIWWKNCSL